MSSSPIALARNRSMPDSVLIPVLHYADAAAAAAWLCRAFGLTERLRIASHRVQLLVPGGGAVVAADGGPAAGASACHSLMVRVADVDAHHARARAAGAELLSDPVSQPYGERQYSARDLGGHVWTFSQSIADVDPAEWGGEWLTRGVPVG
jgi:uncharacterized glyoxalase superfamily protein PhnB